MISETQFIEIAMSFPEVSEEPHFEKKSFRVKKKIFATLNSKNQQVVLKLNEIDQSVFCSFDSIVIYPVPNSWGKQGWTNIELKLIELETLIDALKVSYETVSGKMINRN